jgi:hypothetical protein
MILIANCIKKSLDECLVYVELNRRLRASLAIYRISIINIVDCYN